MTEPGQSDGDVKAWAHELETAGLVQVRIEAPGVELAALLTVGEAHDLAEQIENAAVVVEMAAAP